MSSCHCVSHTNSHPLSSRDIMNRSDSDSALPHGDSRGQHSAKPFFLPPRLHPLQASRLTGGALEKSSSLGELRGSPAATVMASSISTRSLCITPDSVDTSLLLSSSASPNLFSSCRGMGVQPSPRRSPAEEDGGDDSESSGSRRRNAFNKIFKKKQGRH